MFYNIIFQQIQTMEKLKQYAQSGMVEIKKLDDKSNLRDVTFAQVSDQVNRQNKNGKILKSIQNLSWDQKYQWVNFKRLKGKEAYQNGSYDQAIEIYIESLLGIDLNDNPQGKLAQMKEQLQYPIMLNIVTCLYMKKQYKKGVHLCDKILAENEEHLPALYKKAYLLVKCGNLSQAKILMSKGINLAKKIGKEQHLKNFIQLNGDIIKATRQNKSVYAKMFSQETNADESTSAQGGEQSQQSKLINKKILNSNKKLEQQILFYQQQPTNICGKITRACKNIIGYVMPSLGTQKHKIKKILHTAKSI